MPYENTMQEFNRTRFPNALIGQIGAFGCEQKAWEEPMGFRTPDKFYALVNAAVDNATKGRTNRSALDPNVKRTNTCQWIPTN